MRLRKDVLVAVLATFCISSALFAVKPSGSQATLPYNPWSDINDDGKIDIFDVVSVTALYGQTGNPTKPVIINHNWKEGNYSFNLQPNKCLNISIDTSGFKIITLSIHAYSKPTGNIWGPYKFEIFIAFLDNTGRVASCFLTTGYAKGPKLGIIYDPWYKDPDTTPSYSETFSVQSPRLIVTIYNNRTDHRLDGYLYYYLST